MITLVPWFTCLKYLYPKAFPWSLLKHQYYFTVYFLQSMQQAFNALRINISSFGCIHSIHSAIHATQQTITYNVQFLCNKQHLKTHSELQLKTVLCAVRLTHIPKKLCPFCAITPIGLRVGCFILMATKTW